MFLFRWFFWVDVDHLDVEVVSKFRVTDLPLLECPKGQQTHGSYRLLKSPLRIILNTYTDICRQTIRKHIHTKHIYLFTHAHKQTYTQMHLPIHTYIIYIYIYISRTLISTGFPLQPKWPFIHVCKNYQNVQSSLYDCH